MSNTKMRPWQAAILSAFALLMPAVQLVAAAPGAHADINTGSDTFYLDLLKGTYAYNQYGEQALLQEGHKVCNAIRHGATEDNATNMVQSDLGAPNNEAFRVVISIELGLDCYSLKNQGMP
jgi:hypothetical protein